MIPKSLIEFFCETVISRRFPLLISILFNSCFTSSSDRSKKSSLVSGNRPGEKIFITYLPHKSKAYENIHFLSQKNTHTNQIISGSRFIRTNLRFYSLKKKQDRALCFSTKKRAVRAVF